MPDSKPPAPLKTRRSTSGCRRRRFLRTAVALRLVRQPGAQFIGGGTNLLDRMKGDVERPLRLLDITHIGRDRIAELPGGGARIGALARNSDAADHALMRQRYPLLAQALLSGASAQLRNMATVGGNLMQHTRCPYVIDPGFDMCAKRAPGSCCGAREGYSRPHPILGASAARSAVNPPDMNVALAALDAAAVVAGPDGERRVAVLDFHWLPGTTPQFDTVLRAGELITAVDLPASPFARHAHHLKVRDRASYAFALVSVTAALDMDGAAVRQPPPLAQGGVAHKPWRVAAAEALLAGSQLSDERCRQASTVARVRFELGAPDLPAAPVSGGSQTVASVGPAVHAAAASARDKLIAMALADGASPLAGAQAGDVGNGWLALLASRAAPADGGAHRAPWRTTGAGRQQRRARRREEALYDAIVRRRVHRGAVGCRSGHGAGAARGRDGRSRPADEQRKPGTASSWAASPEASAWD